MFNIKGRVAVITGGYGVLGASMARCLAKLGVHVAIVGRKPEKGEPLAAELSEIGAEAIFCQADVLDRDALVAAREAIVEKWGAIDVLINAAGGNMPGATIMPDKSYLDIDFSAFNGVMNLNLMGTVIPTVVFGEQMGKQKKGSIINISSMTAQSVVTRVVGYSASKAAIDNFTRWMAVEMAKKVGEGVRVNAIAPGFIKTDMVEGLNEEELVAQIPAGRFGNPEEVAALVGFLCSKDASYITGEVISINGGLYS